MDSRRTASVLHASGIQRSHKGWAVLQVHMPRHIASDEQLHMVSVLALRGLHAAGTNSRNE